MVPAQGSPPGRPAARARRTSRRSARESPNRCGRARCPRAGSTRAGRSTRTVRRARDGTRAGSARGVSLSDARVHQGPARVGMCVSFVTRHAMYQVELDGGAEEHAALAAGPHLRQLVEGRRGHAREDAPVGVSRGRLEARLRAEHRARLAGTRLCAGEGTSIRGHTHRTLLWGMDDRGRPAQPQPQPSDARP